MSRRGRSWEMTGCPIATTNDSEYNRSGCACVERRKVEPWWNPASAAFRLQTAQDIVDLLSDFRSRPCGWGHRRNPRACTTIGFLAGSLKDRGGEHGRAARGLESVLKQERGVNTSAVARHYDKLTPQERFRLVTKPWLGRRAGSRPARGHPRKLYREIDAGKGGYVSQEIVSAVVLDLALRLNSV
jgi:hypothetical protein